MVETTQGNCWKGVSVQKVMQTSTKSPKFSFGVTCCEKIENIGQTELDFALIMPKMDSPLKSSHKMVYVTSYSKTSIFT